MSGQKYTPEQIEEWRFPVGRETLPTDISGEDLQSWINNISGFGEAVKRVSKRFDDASLEYRYRPDGWTARQVIHHCADSHMNALIRFKLALTEKNPTIKPYEEARWAELHDTSSFPIEPSLWILKGLHLRWGELLRSLEPRDFKRTFHHPERGTAMALDVATYSYDWHCRHHLTHLLLALENKF